MAIPLNNVATMNGRYDNIAFEPQSANITARLVNVSFTIAANSTVWAGRELTYTVTLANDDPTLPLTNLVLTSDLNPVLTRFVDGSVAFNGAAAPADNVTYNATAGLLRVQMPDIAPETTRIISFRFARK